MRGRELESLIEQSMHMHGPIMDCHEYISDHDSILVMHACMEAIVHGHTYMQALALLCIHIYIYRLSTSCYSDYS